MSERRPTPRGERGEALPLRPDDLLAFRLGRLLLLLDTVPGLAVARSRWTSSASRSTTSSPTTRSWSSGATPSEHETLVLAGFDSRNLSYQSSAQRFSSRRERLQHDLATLLAYGLVSAASRAHGVLPTRLTEPGRQHARELRSLYAQAYRRSAELVGRELNRLSDRALQEQTREWLQADELLIDLFEPVPAASEVDA